ncbi:hypothetical protein [Nitrospirillum amazonense]|uniref:Invasion protein IalB n=1 Tax=Nitrospirillum amazonense TaxID=28077 RepID=A0A560JCS4_9PROT|nr:hypothetical protein [Nitrospirillum amazonense]MDG3440020.1 hypothetical protein [Nitrospirillum amazonense]TWB68836.1 hypothetical protein FBZ87_110145 [Nitrospirillum amazonense]
MRRLLLLGALAGVAVPAMAADTPRWMGNGDKAGLAHDGAGEFSGMALGCEAGPLTLWLETDCGGDDTCPVALVLDGRPMLLGVGRYVADGMSGVLVPFPAAALDRLGRARRLQFRIGSAVSPAITTEGLAGAMSALKANCAAS